MIWLFQFMIMISCFLFIYGYDHTQTRGDAALSVVSNNNSYRFSTFCYVFFKKNNVGLFSLYDFW